MSLSIGVVNINYLEQPDQPMYGFMVDLRLRPMTGFDEYYDDLYARDEDGDDGLGDEGEDEYWSDGGFVELRRVGLIRRATGWAIDKNLSQAERTLLLEWIANLPWRDDYVMLHLAY